MTTHFFDGRPEQYKPGAGRRPQRPRPRRRGVLFALGQPAGCELRELVVARLDGELLAVTGSAPPGPVLVLRALGLGDALAAVPALRGLRRLLPGRPLLLAAPGPPAALLRDCGVVDAVVPTAACTTTRPAPASDRTSPSTCTGAVR